jgi:hypothetical protein
VISGVTVVTNSCAFYFAREAAGAPGARHSLRPLISEGGMFEVKLARMRGEIADLCLCEAVSVDDGCCLKFESVEHSRLSSSAKADDPVFQSRS